MVACIHLCSLTLLLGVLTEVPLHRSILRNYFWSPRRLRVVIRRTLIIYELCISSFLIYKCVMDSLQLRSEFGNGNDPWPVLGQACNAGAAALIGLISCLCAF